MQQRHRKLSGNDLAHGCDYLSWLGEWGKSKETMALSFKVAIVTVVVHISSVTNNFFNTSKNPNIGQNQQKNRTISLVFNNEIQFNKCICNTLYAPVGK